MVRLSGAAIMSVHPDRQVLEPLQRGILHAPSLWTGGQSLGLMDINWPNGDIYNRTRSLLTIVFMTRPPLSAISHRVPMSFAFTYCKSCYGVWTHCYTQYANTVMKFLTKTCIGQVYSYFDNWIQVYRSTLPASKQDFEAPCMMSSEIFENENANV